MLFFFGLEVLKLDARGVCMSCVSERESARERERFHRRCSDVFVLCLAVEFLPPPFFRHCFDVGVPTCS